MKPRFKGQVSGLVLGGGFSVLNFHFGVKGSGESRWSSVCRKIVAQLKWAPAVFTGSFRRSSPRLEYPYPSSLLSGSFSEPRVNPARAVKGDKISQVLAIAVKATSRGTAISQ
jgi:hypothetical protein